MLKLFPAIKLYGVTYYLPNFKSIAFTNLIQSYELSKVVNWMCGRPLFANPVTYIIAIQNDNPLQSLNSLFCWL